MKKNNARIFSDLERIANSIPAPLFWVNLEYVVLGANEPGLQAIGLKREDIIGKTVSEFYPKEVAEVILKDNKKVIKTKRALTFEESMVDKKTGKLVDFLVTRAPLFDDDGVEVIGLVETSMVITERKENERLRIEAEKHKAELQEQEKFRKLISQAADDTQSPLAILLILTSQCNGLKKDKIFNILQASTAFIPINFYWIDVNNKLIGANKPTVAAIGGTSIDDYIGKTAYDFYPFELADNIIRHNNEVIRTGKVLSQEEPIRDVTTGQTKYFFAFKAPLYDDKGDAVGLVGTSVDITTEKNAERLKLEAAAQKLVIEEQEKFRKVADQVVHDIRSPLASLSMMLKVYDKDIPEQIRIPLREASTNISDIANNLLSRYEKDDARGGGIEEPQPVMISLVLSHLLSDKKYQYREMNIKFTDEFSQKCIFTFIKVQPSSLKRMLSNLVNNAVEALEGKKGAIHLNLSIEADKVKIVIQDNGKGMPQETIDKILNGVHVDTDKKEGHGIGLTQIRDTITNNQGKLAIESKLGEGTKMIITFPIIDPPKWITKDIKINKGDTVVILDDDRSIHGAWDSRFKGCLNDIQLKHFLTGTEVIDFISTFQEKEKVFLLTDYELLKQDLNGMDIIQKTGIKRAILVTSHHAEVEIRNLAVKNGIKILPKQLASEVPIEICETNKMCSRIDKAKKVDIVVIDDDEILGNSMVMLFENYNKTTDRYPNPKRFLEKKSLYPKDIKIFTDNNFGSNSITGVELAKQLHEMGFTNLYLFSGRDFEAGEVPDYLKLIPKTDIDGLCKAIQ